MKVIIAGSRDLTDPKLVEQAIESSGFQISEVVCGMQRGVDMMGKNWGDKNHIPVIPFPADWSKYKLGAGPIRNRQMANYADALIAIRFGGEASKGTTNMI